MKKRVGIVTITFGENYGNRLQNYALQEVVKSLGYEAETLQRNVYNSFLSQVKNRFCGLFRKKIEKQRKRTFQQFNNLYIKFSEECLYKRKPNKHIAEKYDAFISGSDQIWNPNWDFNSDIDFLTFAHENQRITYAASFGVEEIPEVKKFRYQRWLLGFKEERLSVREETGVRIVEELTGQSPKLHIDPTMLLPVEKWSRIERKPNNIDMPHRYILVYCLSNVKKDDMKYIEKRASDIGAKLIYLNSLEHPEWYVLNPAEFIYLIHKATLVFTDSFHGCVFSMLYHVPFVVLHRKKSISNMEDRIFTLLRTFHMEKRDIENLPENIFECEFDTFEEILNRERLRSTSYLACLLPKAFPV